MIPFGLSGGCQATSTIDAAWGASVGGCWLAGAASWVLTSTPGPVPQPFSTPLTHAEIRTYMHTNARQYLFKALEESLLNMYSV